MKLPSWRWVGTRLIEIAAAVSLFYMVATLVEYRDAVAKANVPPEQWFELNDLFVPDHEVGDDPDMIYARVIKESHRGFWVAEAQLINPDGRQGVFKNQCSGSGVADYDMNEVLGKGDVVSWSWFFGRPCVVPAGLYRIQLTRDMTIPGYPVKQDRYHSNTFRVWPKGKMP